jgi:hypothetical protein
MAVVGDPISSPLYILRIPLMSRMVDDLPRQQDKTVVTDDDKVGGVVGVVLGVDIDHGLGLDIVVFDNLGHGSFGGMVLDGIHAHAGQQAAATWQDNKGAGD